jgi:hypothetical protein
MKKNLLWMLAAILFCGVLSTSCSTEDEEIEPQKITIYNYSVLSSELTLSMEDLSELGLLDAIPAEYTAAILKVTVPDGSKEQDTEVISACDKVYESQKAKYAGKLGGKITIQKSITVNAVPKESKVLKVYTY